jgi:dienelactone hydrolase
VLVFAKHVESSLGDDPNARTARILAGKGWLCASLDLPCHGPDIRPGEPERLDGWAFRIRAGEDIVAPLCPRVAAVIDHLVATGEADAGRIAAYGVSRGGFIACHVAAIEPRIRAVALFSPVTDLAALQEFKGMENHSLTRSLRLSTRAGKLAATALWMSIASFDERVDTDAAIGFTRKVVAAAAPERTADLSLHVLPGIGHATPEGAYEEAAVWIERKVGDA